MFSFATLDHINLATSGIKRSRILPSNPKKQKLSHISEVKSDTSTIGPTILTDFVPDDVRNVTEAPLIHYAEAFW